MSRTTVWLCLFAVASSLVGAGTAKAGMLPGSAAALLEKGDQTTLVTFWGEPYPYRYVPWRRCPRVRVETPYGWYWDRVCINVGAPVLRRAY